MGKLGGGILAGLLLVGAVVIYYDKDGKVVSADSSAAVSAVSDDSIRAAVLPGKCDPKIYGEKCKEMIEGKNGCICMMAESAEKESQEVTKEKIESKDQNRLVVCSGKWGRRTVNKEPVSAPLRDGCQVAIPVLVEEMSIGSVMTQDDLEIRATCSANCESGKVFPVVPGSWGACPYCLLEADKCSKHCVADKE